MEREILFSEELRICLGEEESVREFSCEVARKGRETEIRMVESGDIFNIYQASVGYSEYEKLREEQGLRVNYERFVAKLLEMLRQAKDGALSLLLSGNTLSVVEKDDFRNIVRLEIKVNKPAEQGLKRYIVEVMNKLERKCRQLKEENLIYKEDLRRAAEAHGERVRRLEEEARTYRDTCSRAREEAEKATSHLRAVKDVKEKEEEARKYEERRRLAEAEESLREKERAVKTLEEDLAKANEIIRKVFEESKARRKEKGDLEKELEEETKRRVVSEEEAERLKEELLNTAEELKYLRDREAERKEVISSLKSLNKTLARKLDTAHRIYARIYSTRDKEKGVASPYDDSEDTCKTEDTTSSIIVPERIPQ